MILNMMQLYVFCTKIRYKMTAFGTIITNYKKDVLESIDVYRIYNI